MTATRPPAHPLPDPTTENYLTLPDIPNCVYRAYPAAPFAAGDLYFGYSPTDATSLLQGAIDNVNVANATMDKAQAQGSDCIEQP